VYSDSVTFPHKGKPDYAGNLRFQEKLLNIDVTTDLYVERYE